MSSSSSMRSNSRKRNSLLAVAPPSVAWLEQLAFGMRVEAPKSQRHGVHFTLAMTKQHSSSSSSSLTPEWTLSRPFDDYRALQKRLLKLMSHGHFCSAECPWLYTFVKSYFPKKSFFGSTSTCSRLTERRREALLRCFDTLQTFLLNRANHGCTVVVDAVANELLQFVLQDAGKDHPLKRQLSFDGFNVGATGRFSSESITSDEDETGSSTDFESSVCTLCDCSLEAEPHSNNSNTVAEEDDETETQQTTGTITSLPSFQSASSGGVSYTTTLSCGHQFHDECIVLKLNEAMQCPTCGAKQASHR
ncbi:hypothetical protein Gpo141_00010719 [Globisporangium polare]